MTNSADDRTERLLELYAVFDGQEHAIKDEENGWVRNHWAFYLALATLGVYLGRAIASRGAGPLTGRQAFGVCVACLLLAIVSLAATGFFITQITSMRRAYYGVRDRTLRVLRALRVDDPATWGGHPLNSAPIKIIAEIADRGDWERLTKPRATFRGRLGYLIIGHAGVISLHGAMLLMLAGWVWFLVYSVMGAVSAVWLGITYNQILGEDFRYFARFGRGRDAESAGPTASR